MNFFISTAYAMAGQPGTGTGQQTSWYTTLVPLVIIFAIFYFLMIRPQQRQQKKHREMLTAMRKGDKVVTRGGIHGTIYGMNETTVTVEVTENVRMKFSREAIAVIQPQS